MKHTPGERQGLPARDQQHQRLVRHAQEHPLKDVSRILVIDDEEQVISIEKEILENFGFHVTAFTNAEEALEWFLRRPEGFDLVITDYSMPEMNGLQLAVALGEIRPGIPIILITGLLDINQDEAKRAGIQEFIMKPVMAHDLVSLVRRVLEAP